MFTGCFTAIITPFKNNKIDFNSLEKLIEDQIKGGITGIVSVGTTGESATLNHEEHKKIIEFTIKTVNKRCLVIAGTGANSTDEALELTKTAENLGADGSLQVTPYYNKPSQEGLYQHFSTIANNTNLPIMLYNVPSRAGTQIDIATVQRLAQIKNISSIKEAGGSVDRVSQILNSCDIAVLSGDDALALPMISAGATGLVSVLSNIVPQELSQLIQYALKDNFTEARKLHYQLYDLMNAMFLQANPIPVKKALNLQNKIADEYRLPLTTLDENNTKILASLLKTNKLI